MTHKYDAAYILERSYQLGIIDSDRYYQLRDDELIPFDIVESLVEPLIILLNGFVSCQEIYDVTRRLRMSNHSVADKIADALDEMSELVRILD